MGGGSGLFAEVVGVFFEDFLGDFAQDHAAQDASGHASRHRAQARAATGSAGSVPGREAVTGMCTLAPVTTR